MLLSYRDFISNEIYFYGKSAMVIGATPIALFISVLSLTSGIVWS